MSLRNYCLQYVDVVVGCSGETSNLLHHIHASDSRIYMCSVLMVNSAKWRCKLLKLASEGPHFSCGLHLPHGLVGCANGVTAT